MRISVVIPTANRAGSLDAAIAALLSNTRPPDEVVIVDQGRDEVTARLVERTAWAGVRCDYVRDHGTGAARSRNLGWCRTTGDVVAFTDDDATVERHWVESIVETFSADQARRIGVLGGKIVPVYESRNPHWQVPARWEYILPAYDQGGLLGDYDGSALPATVNWAMRKELLVTYGGFDERLGPNPKRKVQLHGEDSELALRLSQRGFRLCYQPSMVVYHPVPLARQCQRHLNQSLFRSAAANAYIARLSHPLSSASAARASAKALAKAARVARAWRRKDPRELQGEVSWHLGEAYLLARYAVQGLDI